MIKFVAFDFDGVFTNGKCYFDGDRILKFYNIKDGKALSMLRDHNILTGLISSYKTDKEVQWNDISIQEQITNHLKIDKVSIGTGNKLDILTKWIKEYDFSFEEIAYIGDDLADIEILKKVGFSACPSDGVDDCKQIVDYVCHNKGGKGCVREFVEKVIEERNYLSQTKLIIREIRKEINYQLDNFNTKKIEKICNVIRNCTGNIYFTGIGKSKNAANECCILLKSINIKSFYIDAVECLHGDIGTVRENDLVIMYSKSGNTIELIELIEILKIKKCSTIGVCCDPNSKFEKMCTYTIKLPLNSEIDGNINKIPTNSYISQIIFSNIVVSILKEDIDISIYKSNHLGGNIGKHLESIDKHIKRDFPKFILDTVSSRTDHSIPLYDIIIEMTKKKMGCAFFTDQNNKLIGILTDGDIRRMLLKKKVIESININNINCNYYYETDLNKLIIECKKLSHIPILEDGKIIAVCDITS